MLLAITRMKFQRIVLELSQDRLGSMSGITQADISRLENVRAIPYDCQAQRLAQILGLNPEELQEPASTPEEVPAGGVA